MKPIRRFRSHLSSKIALVFILSMTTIFFLHMVTTRMLFGPKRFPAMTRIGIDHAQYLVDKIGIPANLETARSIHQQLGIQIRIDGPAVSWVSNPDMISFAEVQLEPVASLADTRADFTPHGFCIEIDRSGTRFLFVLHPKRENIRHIGYSFFLILLLYTGLILIVLYLVIQWLLGDIKVLASGMQRIGAGQLDQRMSTKRQDELAQLVHSMNTMSDRIQEMIRSREQLLLDVSHELRSPLTRIKLALEFLDDGATKKAIHDDIGEVEAMIGSLLEVERLSSPHGGLKRTPCSLPVLIGEVCTPLQNRKPGIAVQPLPDRLELVCDRDRIKTALRNLLDNALHYSESDSRPVELSVRETDAEIVISVRDYGCGIPAQDLEHIFEPFYRVDKSRSKDTGGYGLGLNLVHKIVSAHDGRIAIDSQPGRGTVIDLHLPRRV